MNIVIVNMPSGEAPEWIRRAWIGLKLPVEHFVKRKQSYGGVLEHRSKAKILVGYVVDWEKAMICLKQKDWKARGWWVTNVSPSNLVFDRMFCVEVPDEPIPQSPQ